MKKEEFLILLTWCFIFYSCISNSETNESVEYRTTSSDMKSNRDTTIVFEGSTPAENERKVVNDISIDLPSTWEYITTKEGELYSLKTTAPGLNAICDISMGKLSERTTSLDYAIKTRDIFQEISPGELIYNKIFNTKIGEKVAHGFFWLHSGEDEQAMIFAVKGLTVVTLDFQKLKPGDNLQIMKDLLNAVHF